MDLKPKYATIRMDICNQCPQKNHDRNTCTKCGCYLPAKTIIKITHCPMDKWPK